MKEYGCERETERQRQRQSRERERSRGTWNNPKCFKIDTIILDLLASRRQLLAAPVKMGHSRISSKHFIQLWEVIVSVSSHLSFIPILPSTMGPYIVYGIALLLETPNKHTTAKT